ncbi:hypothetical protein, partial [Salinisphaera sp.]|uniref:hypothetical protein n=1 Tax=Salinisphaera sp. TaxID=1914330 RepID=UPI002D794615
FEARKYGGAGLKRTASSDRYHWDWSAMDTIGLWEKVCVPIAGCSWTSEPIGWGAAHAVGFDHSDGTRYQYLNGGNFPNGLDRDEAWGGAVQNPQAASLAAGEFEDHNLAQVGGLQPFYAFRDATAYHDYGPANIAVYVKGAEAISSEHTMLDTVAPEIDTEGAGGLSHRRISAAAKARPVFMRATDLDSFARSDGHYEHGNLFNPFWQPRLVELTTAEKQQIAAALAATP